MTDQTLKDIDRAFKALEERDELLDKIRERIELEKLGYPPSAGYYKAIMKCLQIIDKYRTESEDEEMTILEFAKTYGLDVRKVTQAIDNLKEIQTILSRSDEEKPR